MRRNIDFDFIQFIILIIKMYHTSFYIYLVNL